jgi:HEAT repeat protein
MWSSSATMRDVAAWAIAERSLPALLDRLRDGDVDARLQVVFDLGEHRDLEVRDAVETAAFTDPELVVRSAALNTLFARLAGLTGWERKWIEDVLLSELHHDPDAVEAVALLGIRRAVQPLRELLPTTEYVPVADIEIALRQLR